MLKSVWKKAALILCASVLIAGLPLQAAAKPKNLSKSVKVGDIVYFGKYEQDGNTKNKKEKMEWRVLDKDDDKVLLVSKKVLDVEPYNKEYKDVTWETCTLRKWMNKEFLKNGFSSEERKKIQSTEIDNEDNEEYGTEGGKDTKDKVFLLSIEEAEEYFKSDKKRTAEITKYAIKRMAKEYGRPEKVIKRDWFMKNYNMSYWLRSPGRQQSYAASVDNEGVIILDSYSVENIFGGIRPAIWVEP